MDDGIQGYFLCNSCANKDFAVIHNFSLRFHGVNFSDELIYDRLTTEIYQCTNCKKNFTKKQIKEGIRELKRKGKIYQKDVV